MNLIQRVKAPTPHFFKKLRNIGIALASISGAIIAAPIALPVLIVHVAGYLAVAATVTTAISQVTVCNDTKKNPDGN
jgi:hypothetical protein